MNAIPVVLWCHPRSISTAFERAFLQHSEQFNCLHEPFGDAYYFGPQRQSLRFQHANLPVDNQLTSATFERVCRGILADCGGKRTFVKDMACHVFAYLKDNELPVEKMINTFLIRDPSNAVPSMYKCSVSETTRWGNFDPNEVGYSEQRDLFDYVRNRYQQTPIVVNSQDLVTNPRAVLQKYCDLVNVGFEESMIRWQAKKIELFDKWTGWHDEVQRSTGFMSRVQVVNHDLSLYPPIVRTTIEENQPIYQYLNQFSIKV